MYGYGGLCIALEGFVLPWRAIYSYGGLRMAVFSVSVVSFLLLHTVYREKE